MPLFQIAAILKIIVRFLYGSHDKQKYTDYKNFYLFFSFGLSELARPIGQSGAAKIVQVISALLFIYCKNLYIDTHIYICIYMLFYCKKKFQGLT